MQSEFEVALHNLKSADSKDTVNKLSEMFRNITTFDADEVVVAYQTLSLVGAADQQVKVMTSHLKAALELRMDDLEHEARGSHSQEYQRLSSRFLNLRTRCSLA